MASETERLAKEWAETEDDFDRLQAVHRNYLAKLDQVISLITGERI